MRKAEQRILRYGTKSTIHKIKKLECIKIKLTNLVNEISENEEISQRL